MSAAAAAAVVGSAVVAAAAAAGCLPVDHALASGAAGTRAWPGKTRQSGLLSDTLGNFWWSSVKKNPHTLKCLLRNGFQNDKKKKNKHSDM